MNEKITTTTLYKGYTATIRQDDDGGAWHGVTTHDVKQHPITFEFEQEDEGQAAFESAVRLYLVNEAMERDQQNLQRKIDENGIVLPEYMWPGIWRYVQDGVLFGDFLMAVFENNFFEMCLRADDKNEEYIFNYGKLLYHVPRACHGAPEAVQAWHSGFGLRGIYTRMLEKEDVATEVGCGHATWTEGCENCEGEERTTEDSDIPFE